MTTKKLDKRKIQALLDISTIDGFPYKLTEEVAKIYCSGKAPTDEGVQTYGVFVNNKLVSVMTATFCVVFPCKDSPSGKIVHISGAYTLPEYRHKHYASNLLMMIEMDAVTFGADYICCDSTADGLYLSNEFEPTSENETRMWKKTSAY